MVLSGTQKINNLGHLEIGGCDTVELARKHGTPLYVLDEAAVRAQCRAYRGEFERRYPSVEIVFAGKAFLTTAICKIVEQEGLGLDLSSGGELLTGLRAEFPAQRIFLHGNNKSIGEIEMGLEARVGRIVIDWMEEITLLEERAAHHGRQQDVLLRITPGIYTNTHSYIQTGQLDTKFGIPMSDVLEGVERALQSPHLRLRGFHCHIGSQLFGLDCFAKTIEIVAQCANTVREKTGFVVEEFNLGGGLGIRYKWEDDPPSVSDLAEVVCPAMKEEFGRRALALPKLQIEPGRSIVGEAGVTLYTVGVIKEIPGVRKYVAVDGGMSDNPRPALYGAKYEVIAANKANWEPNQQVTIAGKHCESDTLIADARVPKLEVGDILAVQSTGAYNYSMASNYNRLPKPAVVLVNEREDDVIVRRETLDEILAQDCLPPRLSGKRKSG